ncbi:hypothetical protein ACFQ36_08620 [Arthrobacter sp. GCM10027362]|uniref:hypothetical protein n=1 Tax=Arthrobacter sp. GCM10027362 TaxID=3273379 RepID=UPI00363379B6
MSDFLAKPGGEASGSPNSAVQVEAASTHLEPGAPFPAHLAELNLFELHVLHSRICRQLDREYLTDPAGPHPLTLDRHQELVDELDVREGIRQRLRETP